MSSAEPSARKIAANRRNSRKSTGPKTRAGKARSAINAFKHGFALANLPEAACSEVKKFADQIYPADDPLIVEQATIIAETEITLRALQQQRLVLIERLRDPQVIALAKRDNSLAVAKARSQQADSAWDVLDKLKQRFDIPDDDDLDAILKLPEDFDPDELLRRQPAQPGWRPQHVVDRDENDTLAEALGDLIRLDRYERRTLSRRRHAMELFFKLHASASTPADDMNDYTEPALSSATLPALGSGLNGLYPLAPLRPLFGRTNPRCISATRKGRSKRDVFRCGIV
jgi:hypothetical protein